MGKIINWCSGGMGNRLRPLSTCYTIHKTYDRQLGYCWQPSPGCQAKFNDLFIKDDEWYDLSYDEITSLEDVSIYSEVEYIINDARLYNNNTLLNLYNKLIIAIFFWRLFREYEIFIRREKGS